MKETGVRRADTATSVAGSVEISGRGLGHGNVVLELGDEPGGGLRESIGERNSKSYLEIAVLTAEGVLQRL